MIIAKSKILFTHRLYSGPCLFCFDINWSIQGVMKTSKTPGPGMTEPLEKVSNAAAVWASL